MKVLQVPYRYNFIRTKNVIAGDKNSGSRANEKDIKMLRNPSVGGIRGWLDITATIHTYDEQIQIEKESKMMDGISIKPTRYSEMKYKGVRGQFRLTCTPSPSLFSVLACCSTIRP